MTRRDTRRLPLLLVSATLIPIGVLTWLRRACAADGPLRTCSCGVRRRSERTSQRMRFGQATAANLFEFRRTPPPARAMLGTSVDGRLAVSLRMAELERLPERMDVLERKLDALSASVDQRFEEVNARFDEVDSRFEGVDRRFEEVDRRFNEIDKRFDEVSEAFVEQRQYTEFAFARLEARMNEGFARLGSQVDANSEGLARVERKLDLLIDRQLGPETTPKPSRPRRR